MKLLALGQYLSLGVSYSVGEKRVYRANKFIQDLGTIQQSEKSILSPKRLFSPHRDRIILYWKYFHIFFSATKRKIRPQFSVFSFGLLLHELFPCISGLNFTYYTKTLILIISNKNIFPLFVFFSLSFFDILINLYIYRRYLKK